MPGGRRRGKGHTGAEEVLAQCEGHFCTEGDSAGTGCPGRSRNPLPWRYPKPGWCHPAQCSVPGGGVGPEAPPPAAAALPGHRARPDAAVSAAGAAMSGPGPCAAPGRAGEADRTLFVGNLESRVREEILYELFLQVAAGPGRWGAGGRRPRGWLRVCCWRAGGAGGCGRAELRPAPCPLFQLFSRVFLASALLVQAFAPERGPEIVRKLNRLKK